MTGPYDIGDDAIHELEKEYERGYSDGIAAAARDLAALRAENAKLREALQSIIDQNPDPKFPYGRIVVEIAHEALSH